MFAPSLLKISAAGTIASTLLLSGCAGSRSMPGSAPGVAVPSIGLPGVERTIRGIESAPAQPNVIPFPSDRWVNTAQLYGNDAKIYRRHGVQLAFVKSLMMGIEAPQGTVATNQGWWYVTNGGHSNVLVYRSTNHGPRGPFATLDDYGQIPVNVDATNDRQLVAVANVSTLGGAPGSVSIYLRRRVEPSRNLTYGSDAVQGIGVAIDQHGNCYWSFNDPASNKGSIVKFKGCTGKGKPIVGGIAFAGGLTFDRRGNLYYVDQTSGIYKCAGTNACSLFARGFGDPVNINFDSNEHHLWVADATGYIDAVDRSGKIVYRKDADGGEAPYGVAPVPGD
ncbi:MAG TPA: hypothetical protein VJP76_04335 [Candidatus Tumulicola sp.]|nr:hypothetical protein [Candidatus Tumulicola sp.]